MQDFCCVSPCDQLVLEGPAHPDSAAVDRVRGAAAVLRSESLGSEPAPRSAAAAAAGGNGAAASRHRFGNRASSFAAGEHVPPPPPSSTLARPAAARPEERVRGGRATELGAALVDPLSDSSSSPPPLPPSSSGVRRNSVNRASSLSRATRTHTPDSTDFVTRTAKQRSSREFAAWSVSRSTHTHTGPDRLRYPDSEAAVVA